MSDNKYIWTNHAIKRANERKIPQNLIIETINNPDFTKPNKFGGLEFQKKVNNQTIAAIIKDNEKGEKIILSCWVNPPNPGTRDFKRKQRYREMQKASVLKRIWLTFLEQIGL